MAVSNNTIRFKLDIVTDGSGKIKELGIDAKDLADAINFASNSAKEAKSNFEKMGTAALMGNAINTMFQGLNSAISELTQAYQVQEQAEAQLATAMRNTMDATDAQIQSVKDLCSAQQELGVIGDEVQLQGAQELATYLETTDALKQLIPVMNDMVAQQYGIGASGENAASIATMLGKVMNGQTKALSRLGYSFTEAEEEVIKFGTEEEKAAMLAEVVNRSVGGMNAALAQTDSGKIAQLNNTLGDLKEGIGKLANKLAPVLISLNSMVSMGGKLVSLTKVMGAAGSAVKAFIVAYGALSIPITAIALPVAALTLRYRALTKAQREQAEQQRRMVQLANEADAAISGETAAVDVMFNRLKRAKEGTEEYNQARNEIISKYGEYLQGLIDEQGELKNIEAAYKRITDAVRESIKERMRQSAVEKETEKYGKVYGERVGHIVNTLQSKIKNSELVKQLKNLILRDAEQYGRLSDEVLRECQKYVGGEIRYGRNGVVYVTGALRELTGSVASLRKAGIDLESHTKDINDTLENAAKQYETETENVLNIEYGMN